MRYRTVTETAARWNVTPGRIRQWILAGRIPGTVRAGPLHLIPADAVRPRSWGPRGRDRPG